MRKIHFTFIYLITGLPRWFSAKNPPANAGDVGSIPELGRSSGEEYGNSLQFSCLGNPMDRGTWQAIVHRVARDTT